MVNPATPICRGIIHGWRASTGFVPSFLSPSSFSSSCDSPSRARWWRTRPRRRHLPRFHLQRRPQRLLCQRRSRGLLARLFPRHLRLLRPPQLQPLVFPKHQRGDPVIVAFVLRERPAPRRELRAVLVVVGGLGAQTVLAGGVRESLNMSHAAPMRVVLGYRVARKPRPGGDVEVQSHGALPGVTEGFVEAPHGEKFPAAHRKGPDVDARRVFCRDVAQAPLVLGVVGADMVHRAVGRLPHVVPRGVGADVESHHGELGVVAEHLLHVVNVAAIRGGRIVVLDEQGDGRAGHARQPVVRTRLVDVAAEHHVIRGRVQPLRIQRVGRIHVDDELHARAVLPRRERVDVGRHLVVLQDDGHPGHGVQSRICGAAALHTPVRQRLVKHIQVGVVQGGGVVGCAHAPRTT
mmetsp:Transcript_41038/g.65781  ORF Transcript_41038/g.65781 Transcript_41038/m.65781 type:complete len:406 (+) Transcript_41038:488-1705(+)